MLETLRILGYLRYNQVTMQEVMQKISREVAPRNNHGVDPSETTRRSPQPEEIKAYLQGALHDASRNKQTRVRFVQKGTEWLELLKNLLEQLGHKSWIYREGKDREVYALETTASFLNFDFDPTQLNQEAKIAYIRGFFDAEGGIPRSVQSKFYIQLVQKDRDKILMLKTMLYALNISTGVIHNPSERVDPNYWRIFVSTRSHSLFVRTISSWHPRKYAIFRKRMMI